MIEKLPNFDSTEASIYHVEKLYAKVNQLVDAVNGILAAQEQYATIYNEDIVPMLTPQNEEPETPADNSGKANCQENVQPDYITTTYTTDGKQKKYYGQNGACVEISFPLPAGYVITIRESETKGGDNE